MFKNRFFKKITRQSLLEVDQVKLVYFLSLVIGLLSALAAALLKYSIHYIHKILTQGITSEPGTYLYLAFPLIGMFLTFMFVKFIVRDNISHGISRILFSISRKKGKLNTHNTWTSIIASTLTIGFGGSVGAEAPIVLTGSSIGSAFGRFFKLNYKNVTLLIGCGAAGAVSGIFKAPIAGIVFTLEILMLDLTISSIVPLLISSVTAATVAYFLMGNNVLFNFNVIGAFNISNIPWYLLLGIISGLISLYFSKMTLFLEGSYNKITNAYLRPVLGGIVLGGLIYLFPPFYGEGYDTIMSLLQGNTELVLNNSIFSHFSGSFWVVVLFMSCLVLLKVVASSSTNGAGGVGGIFAPTLFLGGINGYLVADILKRVANVELPDNRFVLVGMAGMMAGVMHAPMTAIFLIAEITGGFGLFIPLMITSAVAYLTIMPFEPHSIYHKRLALRGELITNDKIKEVFSLVKLMNVIETDLLTINIDSTLGELVKVISKSKRNIFPVIDNENNFQGVILLDDIREIMFDKDRYDKTYVKDILTAPPAIILPNDKMDIVMKKFSESKAWNLPVVHEMK